MEYFSWLYIIMNINWSTGLYSLLILLIVIAIIHIYIRYRNKKGINAIYDTVSDIQGITIDEHYLYVITNSSIYKYSRKSSKMVLHKRLPFHHMGDAKMVNGDLIIVNNANNPAIVWIDPNDLSVIDLITPDYVTGHIAWVDWAFSKWWLCDEHEKSCSRILCYDNDWNLLGFWTLPKGASSNITGGAWLDTHLMVANKSTVAFLKTPPNAVPALLVRSHSLPYNEKGFIVEKKSNGNVYVWCTRGSQVVRCALKDV